MAQAIIDLFNFLTVYQQICYEDPDALLITNRRFPVFFGFIIKLVAN